MARPSAASPCCTASGVLEVGDSRGRRRRVGAPPGRGVRGRPVLHRHAEAVGAHLEARDAGPTARAGASKRSTSSTQEQDDAVDARRLPPDRRGDLGRRVAVLYLRSRTPVVARVGHRQLPPRDAGAGAPRRRGRRPAAGGGAERVARDLAIDLGTANTLVYERGRGIVLNEPTVIALNTRTREVLAMGHDAWQMIGRTPSDIVAERPLRQGAITDFDVTQRMIRLLLHRVRVGPVQPPPGRGVRAVGHHRGRAAGGGRGRPPGRRHRRLPHRPAHGGRHRVGPADPRAGRQPGHRRGRRHDRDRAHLARRGRRPRRRAGRQLRLRRRHPGLRAARVRHRGGRAHRRGDQGRHRVGVAGARRAQGRGAGPRPGLGPAEDGHPHARPRSARRSTT